MKAFLLFIYIPLVLISPAWNLNDWTLHSEPCAKVIGEELHMRCVSTGLVSKRHYDLSQGLTVSVEVRGGPAPESSTDHFWIGLVINGDLEHDNHYAEAALTYKIAPYDLSIFDWMGNRPWGVALVTPGGSCCNPLTPIDPDQWHTLSVTYKEGSTTISVDGISTTTTINMPPNAQIELLCGAVDPDTPGNTAIADCVFRNLRVS